MKFRLRILRPNKGPGARIILSPQELASDSSGRRFVVFGNRCVVLRFDGSMPNDSAGGQQKPGPQSNARQR